MKNIFTLALIVIVGFFTYTYLLNPLSEEEQRVKAFETDFREAVSLSNQAGRTAALGGVDTTSTFEEGYERVKRIKSKLEDIMENFKEDKAYDRANDLMKKIEQFLKENNRLP
jgi:16S rRNA C1402 (ribose-2'-O) methylase RsmI